MMDTEVSCSSICIISHSCFHRCSDRWHHTKGKKKARHRRTTIPVRDASAPVAANSVQRNRTLSVQEHPSSVATGQRGQRAGRSSAACSETEL